MKLLLATSSISYNGGGISSYAIDFLKLMSRNYECFVIAGDVINIENRHLIKKEFCVNMVDFSLKNLDCILKIIKEVKPNIIVNSNFQLLSLAIPYVDLNIIKISVSHFVDGQLAIVAGFNYKYYNTIIVLSNEAKFFLDKFYKINDLEKVKVIYNFYHTNKKENKLKRNNLPLVITFPGGSSLHKNPNLVFSLLKLLQKTELQFKFYWLGDTKLPGNRFFNIGNINDLIPKDERIIFTNRIPRIEATDIIYETNIFLLPSKKEGCPISLLEAISSGTIPLISDSKHASSELICDGESGFVLPEKIVKPYLDIIIDIINNHKKYFNIYSNSTKLYQLKLSEEKWREQMFRIFENLTINKEVSKKEIKKLEFIKERFIFRMYLFIQRIKQILKSMRVFVFFLREKLFQKIR